VIGGVLSGALSDGTAGLRAIRRCGGVAVVQDPSDAAFPSMPASALRHVEVDHCLPAAEMGPLLARLAAEPAGAAPEEIPFDIRLETAIAAQEPAGMSAEDKLGTPSRFTCPECHGTLWEITDGPIIRYRCHAGHAFSSEAMLMAQANRIEETLWSLLRSHQERAALARRLAERETSPNLAAALKQKARDYAEDAEVIRRLIAEHSDPTQTGTPEDNVA
jgi:two-component system chemotaxis response regulator CheB